jgi:nucleolar GTP-binding protein
MIRMVKYGDSLYRCKCLKRAALGRMCTVLKRQKASLAYLEEVRKHMSRLPALDPNTRTLLMCGLPNVGKSSFMNKVTRANVDVQPYAFTTKSLFVGHMDYRYLRWQVIDTPGILDHSLEERNTIEMQAITALAHLTCSVLYFIDISEQCGYTIEQQCSLFRSIKPLFANKELIIVVNKIDVQPWETLDAEKKGMVEQLIKDSPANCTFMTMSNISEEGVSQVKATACDKLLASRVESRIGGKKIEGVMNRLQVFYPNARDNLERDVCIPDTVKNQTDADAKKTKSRIGYAPTKDDEASEGSDGDDEQMGEDSDKKKTARDIMWENGGPGVWAPDYREQYDLKDPEWRFDAIPEILDGKNIADFVDPDIDAKLAALEKEEEQLAAEMEAANMGDEESDLDEEEEAAVEAIRERKNRTRMMSHVNRTDNKSMMPRTIRGRAKDKHDAGALNADEIKKKMDGYGVDTSKMLERGRKRGRSIERRRGREASPEDADIDDADMDVDGMSKGQLKKQKKEKKDSKKREHSLARSHSRPREPSQMGLKDEAAERVAKKLDKLGKGSWEGLSGEGDQRKSVHLVKWMNTGKKRMGTHNRR